MPEHNTSHDGRIIRLRQVKKRKFIQVPVRCGLESLDMIIYFFG